MTIISADPCGARGGWPPCQVAHLHCGSDAAHTAAAIGPPLAGRTRVLCLANMCPASLQADLQPIHVSGRRLVGRLR